MNILVVDDHAINRRLLRAQLEAERHAVLEASDGLDALVVLEREPVDAIISDILMPRMDGFRLCREVRQSEKLRALPFILYTSTYDSSSDRNLAHTVGADRYVIKPAPTAVILEAVHEAMQKTAGNRCPPPPPQDEAQVLQQYSEVLVHKLEKRNTELQTTLAELERAHEEILQFNRDLEERVRERTAQLEAANKELEAFSYSVSHDLRAPLRHIDGFTAKLRQHLGARLDERSDGLLATITESARGMSQLIDDLLGFARIGRIQLRRLPVSLDEIAADAQRNLQDQIAGRAIAWQIAPLPTVEGDAALLRQVFANLIGNAVKYTGRCPEARIEIGTQPGPAGETVVFVRDNGAGFEMKHAGKLFGVFQRLHAQTEFEGTGVGLATVRRIVERHGGRIWAESAVNQGATFYFTLPAANP